MAAFPLVFPKKVTQVTLHSHLCGFPWEGERAGPWSVLEILAKVPQGMDPREPWAVGGRELAKHCPAALAAVGFLLGKWPLPYLFSQENLTPQ